MGYDLADTPPRVGQVPLLIFAYLGFSLLVSGFIMTVLAYAPTDSYLMVLIQSMGVMGFLGPIVLVIGTIMLLVSIFYCLCTSDDDDDYD
ncbi:hypothetical protein Pcinc_024494 [Petrolisthes cinctipes]|uniref:Uncharacterized protein n=1 Tax=Petrolisthes cinctipes TaxID=88211 RepID=A0AAE1F351_PETCI|nr:hypothetical protein Pcinc_028699 [Petrolisthes cinctipes]KAK3870257.1 hypothetical protein Pcinc_024494 [Petrolisthes cinctipes]